MALLLLAFEELSVGSTPGCSPPQPRSGGRLGAVFTANPAAIPQRAQAFENGGVVHLAHIGLVTIRHPGNLDMANGAELAFEMANQVAFHDLAVVKVELQLEIRGTDLFQYRHGLGLAREKSPACHAY